MGWFIRRKKKTEVETPDLWTVCSACKAHVFKEKWESASKVCPQCGFHDRLTAQERVELIADAGTFEPIAADVGVSDPLKFSDAKGSYAEKARIAQSETGMKESVLTGHCKIESMPAVLAVMDFRFMGGSLGGGTGEKILRAAEWALRKRTPYIIFSASGGARMHEGIVSLMQMAKTCAGIARLQRERIPYISVMTNPTFGGVSASFATVGDLNLAEPGALIGFAGRRVIEQTIKQKLPEDFQTAEYLKQHGFLDQIVHRKDMKAFLHRVLEYWTDK